MVTLWDVNDGDATLAFHEGSNGAHKAFGETFGITNKSDWYKIGGHHQLEYMKDYPQRCVKAKAGSLILWDSRTVHQGIEPRKDRAGENIRCVVYTCYLPRSHADEANLQKKREAFEEGRMTSHWPNRIKVFPKLPRSNGKPVPNVTYPPKPKLTDLGLKLAGF